MPQLPPAHIASSPLFTLSLALGSGTFLQEFLLAHVGPSLPIAILTGGALTLATVLLIRQRKMGIALVTVTAGFVLAGIVLKEIEDRSASSVRLFRMFED